MSYALIRGSEDGNPILFIDKDTVNELMKEPLETASVERFLEKLPDNKDANYWPEGDALLIKYEILKPRPVTSSYTLD